MEYVTAIGTILGIVAVMLVRDWRDGKALFKKNSSTDESEIIASHRNDMQPLLSQMENLFEEQRKLKSYYNHDTSEALTLLRTTQLQQCVKLDLMVESLQDMARNGIRIRK